MSVTSPPLAELLAAHAPADEAEADSLRRIQALSSDGQDAYTRARFEPGHLTASAVVFDPSRARCALIFHEKLQLWLQPGGHFEPGDERVGWRAAQREVLEETCLETDHPEGRVRLLDVDVHRIPARKKEPTHEHFDLRYLFWARPGQELVAGDGAAGARWVTRAQAQALDLDPGLKRALAKLDW